MNNQTTQPKTRNSNLELYRIIVMLLIIAHHYVVNSRLGGVLQENPLSERSIFFYLFGAWGKTGINCFIMITGYFMCKSQITHRKFLKLLFEVLFYNVIIYAIFIATGYESLSLTGIENLIPMRNLSTNFISCFLVFFFCIPFLNVLILHLNKQKHQQLIGLCLFIYTLHGTLPHTSVNMNYVSWFCVIYFIASYIRLYSIPYDKNIKFWGICTLLCIGFSICSILGVLYLNTYYHTDLSPYRYVSDSNSFLAALTAICSFIYFKNLHFPQSKFINLIGSSTFGVLLIHANSDTMRKWLWFDFLDNASHYQDRLFWIYPILSVLCIFIICVIIDKLRVQFIENRIFT